MGERSEGRFNNCETMGIKALLITRTGIKEFS
jgi:hypothetical protein